MKTDEKTVHAYSVNYRKQGDRDAWLNRGFWISGLPRVTLACRSASGVRVSDASVEKGRWVSEACAAIAAHISELRTKGGWEPAADMDTA